MKATSASEVPPHAPPRRTTRFEIAPKTMFLALAIIAGASLAVKLVPVLLMLIAALMIVGTLNPIVAWLEAKRVGRKLALTIVFTVAVGVTALLLFLTVPPLVAQLQHMFEREPQVRGRLIEFLQRSPLTTSLANQLSDLDYAELLASSRSLIITVTTRTVEMAAYLVAAVFLGLYIMIDRDRLRGALFALVPRRNHLRFSHVLLNLETIVGGYIRGQVITCLLMTGFLLLVLMVCRVPNALALAIFGGVMDVLPYIGPLLTIGPAVFAAYGNGPVIAVVVFVALLLYEEFEGRILVPVVYGRSLRLPSSIVFFALIAGGALAGIIGALLALPLAAAVVMIVDEMRVELPGETEHPKSEEIRRKDEREEKVYERLTERKPVQKAAAIAVEIAKERRDEDAEEKKSESKREAAK